MNEICQRNGTKKNFPELSDMPFKMESMWTEKTYAKAKIHEISKPKEKGTLKPFRKKKADHTQRIKNQNNIRLLKNDTGEIKILGKKLFLT